eukprot:259058-Lingulodinium_polyedra.AAC.1
MAMRLIPQARPAAGAEDIANWDPAVALRALTSLSQPGTQRVAVCVSTSAGGPAPPAVQCVRVVCTAQNAAFCRQSS